MNKCLSNTLVAMIKKAILGKVCERENRYNSYIFSYGCPGFIFTAPVTDPSSQVFGKPKGIKFLRDSELGRTNKAAKSFSDLLGTLCPKSPCIPEVVHVIDQSMWVETCSWFGVDSVYIDSMGTTWKQFYNKTHLRLDWLFPEYWTNWEHDGSAYHDTKMDEIRDAYLGRVFPGLHIKRFRDYTGSKKQKEKVKDLVQEMMDRGKAPYPLKIDYSESVVNRYIEDHWEDLLILNTYLCLYGNLDMAEENLCQIYPGSGLRDTIREIKKGSNP